MKKRKWLTGLALLLAVALFAFPVMADDQELTDKTTSGDTEVDAVITDGSGEVAYIVTIPEKIDFGTLACPTEDADSYTTPLKFDVTCVKMQGVSNIKVSVCNFGSEAGEANQDFYLTNQTNTACTFTPVYELYVGTTRINTAIPMPVNGFDYIVFSSEGEKVTGGVRLNQRQLYPFKDKLDTIVGSYTGNMVFTIAAS